MLMHTYTYRNIFAMYLFVTGLVVNIFFCFSNVALFLNLYFLLIQLFCLGFSVSRDLATHRQIYWCPQKAEECFMYPDCQQITEWEGINPCSLDLLEWVSITFGCLKANVILDCGCTIKVLSATTLCIRFLSWNLE